MVFCVNKSYLLRAYFTTTATTQAMETNTTGNTDLLRTISKSGIVRRYSTLLREIGIVVPRSTTCPEHDGIKASDFNTIIIAIRLLTTLSKFVSYLQTNCWIELSMVGRERE